MARRSAPSRTGSTPPPTHPTADPPHRFTILDALTGVKKGMGSGNIIKLKVRHEQPHILRPPVPAVRNN